MLPSRLNPPHGMGALHFAQGEVVRQARPKGADDAALVCAASGADDDEAAGGMGTPGFGCDLRRQHILLASGACSLPDRHALGVVVEDPSLRSGDCCQPQLAVSADEEDACIPAVPRTEDGLIAVELRWHLLAG